MDAESLDAIIRFFSSLVTTFFFYSGIPIVVSALWKKPTTAKRWKIFLILWGVFCYFVVAYLYHALQAEGFPHLETVVIYEFIAYYIGKRILQSRKLIPDGGNNTPQETSESPTHSSTQEQPESAIPDAHDISRAHTSQPRKGLYIVIGSSASVIMLILGILIGASFQSTPDRSSGNGFVDAGMSTDNSINYESAGILTPPPTTSPAHETTRFLSKPQNGAILQSPRTEKVAPFSVTAPADVDCLVHLYRNVNSDMDIIMFIRAGKTAEINVPIGVYTLYYATGTEWNGIDAPDNMCFGLGTQWFTSPQKLSFSADDYYYNGHSITLYTVPNGNFETNAVSVEELPF